MTRTDTKAIVILGAMFGARYPGLVPAASARGLAVLGIEVPTPGYRQFDQARRASRTHPLARIGDLAWIPGTQHEQVLEQVIRWQSSHRIAAVLALGENFVEAAGLAADYLGLPSPGLRAARVCRNKLLQRRYLAEWSPQSWLLAAGGHHANWQAWEKFPAVVKPVAREASSGVCRVDDRASLRHALTEYDPAEPLLIEQLVTGHEVSVETLVQSSEVIFESVTGKRTNERGGAFFAEMGHTAPDPDLQGRERAAVFGTNRAVLSRLGFRDGIAHAEYRIGQDGEVLLMEVAARAAGDSILSLYHLATGQPLEDALLAVALGEPASYPTPRSFARQVYLDHQPGTLRDVSINGMDARVTWLTEQWMWPTVRPAGCPTLHMVVAGRGRGDPLGEIRESKDRSIMYVIEAPSAAELDALEARCTAAIALDIAAG